MKHLKFISDLIDELSLDKPIDWESYNYEATKQIALLNAYEKYLELKNNPDQDHQEIGIVSIMAYLMLENASQWVEIMRLKQEK